MSVFDEAHQRARQDVKFPGNPCKFLKVWRDKGDKELYLSILNEGIWLTDPITGEPEENGVIAAVLTDVLGISVQKHDVWKHKADQCMSCRSIRKAIEHG